MDILGKIIDKYGRFGVFILVLGLLIVWGINHHNTPPRNKVLVFGIIEYQKSPDNEAIKSRRELNVKLLHLYFEMQKEKIHHYVNGVYLPLFIESFLSRPTTENIWNQVVKNNTKKDRLKFLQIAGDRIQQQVTTKNIELSKRLNELEWRLIRGVVEEREDIDKIIAITMDELEQAMRELISKPSNEAKFHHSITRILKALNGKANGFELTPS